VDPTLLAQLKLELGQIVESLDDRLTDPDQGELRGLLHRGECGVAFEWLVACLVEDAIPLTPALFNQIQRAGHQMGLDRDLTAILGPQVAGRDPLSPSTWKSVAMTPELPGDRTEPQPVPVPGSESEPEEPGLGPALPIADLPLYHPEEDEEELALEDGPRTVLITGACGNIGRKLRAAWEDVYDLVLLDVAAGPSDPDVLHADLSVLDDDWITHFHNVDTVIHLAGNPNEFSPWEELEGPNLDVLSNVFHAAALAGVERVIFASSNHAMGGYRELGDMPITVELPPRPDSPYGATKLMGERLGRSLARAFDLSFIALRLGWVQHGENRPDTLPDDWARAMWLSNADLVRLFECAVEADLDDRSFVILNGMSNNRGMRWDLTATAELLGYTPEDDAYAEEL
jgi:hypothetical protein